MVKPLFLSPDQISEIYRTRLAQLEGMHLNAVINRRIEETFQSAEVWEVEKGEALIGALHAEWQELLDALEEGACIKPNT